MGIESLGAERNSMCGEAFAQQVGYSRGRFVLFRATPDDSGFRGERSKSVQCKGERFEFHFAQSLSDFLQVISFAYEDKSHMEVAIRAIVSADASCFQGILYTYECFLELVVETYSYEYAGHK